MHDTLVFLVHAKMSVLQWTAISLLLLKDENVTSNLCDLCVLCGTSHSVPCLLSQRWPPSWNFCLLLFVLKRIIFELYTNDFILYVVFWDLHFSINIMILRLIQTVWSILFFFLHCYDCTTTRSTHSTIAFWSQAYQLGIGWIACNRKLYIKQNDNGLRKIEVYFSLI